MSISERSFVGRLLQGAVAAGILAVLLHPFFFVIFRLMAFNAVPRDDYGPFLLWLLGQPGGEIPSSPYGYRILSMIAAAPFYYALPAIPLTNLPGSLSPQYLQATAAIAALSFCSLVCAPVTAYFLAVDRAGLDKVDGACASALTFVFCWYASIVGIDLFEILLICIGLLAIRRPLLFGCFLTASIVCNEKIAIVFVLWLTTRWLLCSSDRHTLLGPWLISIGAITAYLLMISVIHLPGHSYQVQPAEYPRTFLHNLTVLPTARGLLLNILPLVILAGAALVGWKSVRSPSRSGLFHPIDLLVILELAAVAMTVTQQFQVGRIVMHAAPFYVVPAALALGYGLRTARRDKRMRSMIGVTSVLAGAQVARPTNDAPTSEQNAA